jgi:hypothetical protein
MYDSFEDSLRLFSIPISRQQSVGSRTLTAIKQGWKQDYSLTTSLIRDLWFVRDT